MPTWQLEFTPFESKQTVGLLSVKRVEDDGTVLHIYQGSANLDVKATVDDCMKMAESALADALIVEKPYDAILAKRQSEVN